MARKILFVFTSNDRLHGSERKTGWFLPEAAHPYYILKAAGFELVAASEEGGYPPLDQSSIEPYSKDVDCVRFLQDAEAQSWLKNSIAVADVALPATEYAAVFYPGGYGPLIGLPDDVSSQALIRTFYESGRIVSAVCHAPCVLSEVKLSDGNYLVEGRKLTSFSNDEEAQFNMLDNVPYLVQTRLSERGALFQQGAPWTEHVVVDTDERGRTLVTGANPQSAAQVGRQLVQLLQA